MKSNGKTNRLSQRQNWTWPSYITSGVSGWAAQISASVALDLSLFSVILFFKQVKIYYYSPFFVYGATVTRKCGLKGRMD